MLFLDEVISKNFRNKINSSQIFEHEYKKCYHLICAVMDRIDTCVQYLNIHSDYPESEEAFLSFLMFTCMTLDAVKEVLIQLGIIKKSAGTYGDDRDHLYFKSVCMGEPLRLVEGKCPTDDKFFEYFRSLTFAHPFETSRPKFLQEGEIQYSPWVIANKGLLIGTGDGVGVRIYSNKFDNIKDLRFPFKTLKEYINSRYMQLQLATEWANARIEESQQKWRRQKVDQSRPPVEIFQELRKIMISRYNESYDLDLAVSYLNCSLSNNVNNSSVETYRKAIVATIPTLCAACQSLDDESFYEALNQVLRGRPANIHKMGHYQLEKIFTYLDEDHLGDIEWGLAQANAFASEFAKKWVVITPYEMSFAEIKLLVSTACYLERIRQMKK